MHLEEYYKNCTLCPRNCGVDRRSSAGFCGCRDILKAARAGLHYYEEPFLAGTNGSGTVFFTGCSLGCIYCQNGPISRDGSGLEISTQRLLEIFLEQQERGAHNINLVTGTHFTPSIAEALKAARENGLGIPVVWNSSGYEKPETLGMLQGLVDIFMPDFKTLSPELGMRYMKAADYPERAKEALACMVEMTDGESFIPLETAGGKEPAGPEQKLSQETFSEYEGEGVLMTKGVVVRHLVIPGQTEDSMKVLEYLYRTYGDRIWISLMSQYTPVGAVDPFAYPELCRRVTSEEYERVVDHAIDLGIERCMIQEGDTASESFIPVFDGAGIRPCTS